MARIGLVLGAGGATGHAFHVGVLTALEEATGWDPRTADVIVGTSAGAIVAAMLRGGLAARDLAARALGEALSEEGRKVAAVLGRPMPPPAREPWTWSTLLDAADVAYLKRALWRPWEARIGSLVAAALPNGRIATDHLVGGIARLFGDRWPLGRLWINAVRLGDGARVTFGRAGSPPATIAQAVAASCAIPGYYRPVEIDGVRYVDGGVCSPTNLDLLADERLDLVLVSSPMSAGFDVFRPTADGPLRAFCRLVLRREMARVRASGTSVVPLEPSRVERELMGANALDTERRHGIIRGARVSFHARFADPNRRRRLELLRAEEAGPQILRAAAPTSRVIELGVPVHYVDYGGDGPPMVLVHGLGGAHVNWMSVGGGLARGARVVAIDLPGFGRTPTEGDSASIHANRALLTRFVERVMGDASILVGNSMGGLISLMAAAETPGAVSGLVLVNPALPAAPGGFFDLGVAAMFAGYCLPGVGELLMSGRKLLLGSEGSVRQMLDFCCVDAGRVDPDVVAATIALSQERTRTAGGNAAFLSAARSIVLAVLRRGAFDRMIDGIRAPALLVHGTHDRLVPVAAARALAARRGDWTLEILENVGHVPQLEDPQGFVAIVERWVRRLGDAVLGGARADDTARSAS
ncbi:MAG: alpha/beta fold hydrolase [Deltaproteobacteria bacterium]|nr:alpha/beta fold hydrolase [Deltaproteobacteria bacterium]